MAWYPKARRREVTRFRTRMARPVRINYHTAVTNAASLYDWFNVWGRATSHFYVAKDGTVEQYIDTKYRAAADLEGNPDTISIETWDGYRNGAPGYWKHNGDVPPWTDAQMAALRDLTTWLLNTHPSIPGKVATDSRRGSSSHGLSWHRLGIDGNFPGGRYKGRVPGGLKYSNAPGKVCPGNRRIDQIPQLLFGVKPGDTSPSVPSSLIERLLAMSATERAQFIREFWEFQNRDGNPSVHTLLTRAADKPTLQEIREAQSFHAGKVDAANQRNLAAALANLDLNLSPEETATQIAALLAEHVRQAVTDSIAEAPDRDADEVADAVVTKIAHRLTQED